MAAHNLEIMVGALPRIDFATLEPSGEIVFLPMDLDGSALAPQRYAFMPPCTACLLVSDPFHYEVFAAADGLVRVFSTFGSE